jgi:glycerol-3-phosphate dehydrogenase
VLLVEAQDLAAGTSRWSSKLVHGGLRYLAQGKVGIAWESAVERERIMAAIAPHLTHPMGQVLPLAPGVNARLVAAGVRAGDALRRATGSTLAAPRRLDAAQLADVAPALAPTARGGWLSCDGQLVDDARLVIAVARTAAAYGARIVTHTRVERLIGWGAVLTDSLTGEQWQVRARHVVNATGAWAADLDPRIELVRSRGSHLVLPSAMLGDCEMSLTAPVPGSTSRFVFTLPQPGGVTYVGLTDVQTDDPLESPTTDSDEIAFLLDTLNEVLAVPIGRDDIMTTYAGYRPLLAAAGSTADLSRKHAVFPAGAEGEPISIVGGKLTTYRRMAEDAVDLITERPCRTHRLPLVGAAPWDAAGGRLRQRFGAEESMVAAVMGSAAESLVPIDGTPVLPVELAWAMRAEGAITTADVLERRLRLDVVPPWRAAVADRLARLAPALV